MRIPQTRGKCVRCGYRANRGGLRRHLAECAEPVPWAGGHARRRPIDAPGFLVEVIGRPKAYWLFLGVACDAKLSNLDAQLKASWLECCDHLSEFVIGSTRYGSVPTPTFSLGPRTQSMHIRVGNVLRPGASIEHRYDFGSTTLLDLSVVAPMPITVPPKSVTLLANNEPPDVRCCQCGEAAASVCVECDADGRAFLCATCPDRQRRQR